MKIGIVGAGTVGEHLGKALARVGHSVMFSSRDPHSPKMQQLLQETGAGAQAGTILETVAFGEVIAIAIGWQNGLAEALASVPDWSGKVLIDTTNRFGVFDGSAAEEIAARTGAPVMKAFNTIGAEHLLDPVFDGIPVSMFVCGSPAAKEKALPLVSQIGFDVVDIGGLEQARLLEAMAAVWVGLAMRQGQGRDIAFKLLRK
jgi:hypothetical protein